MSTWPAPQQLCTWPTRADNMHCANGVLTPHQHRVVPGQHLHVIQRAHSRSLASTSLAADLASGSPVARQHRLGKYSIVHSEVPGLPLRVHQPAHTAAPANTNTPRTRTHSASQPPLSHLAQPPPRGTWPAHTHLPATRNQLGTWPAHTQPQTTPRHPEPPYNDMHHFHTPENPRSPSDAICRTDPNIVSP